VKSDEASIARQLLSKHIPADANARFNRRTMFSVNRAVLVATDRCCKHISEALNQHTTIEEVVFSVVIVPLLYNEGIRQKPCGDGVENLHRDPGSLRRR
jgi:hypothetical protein